jgi:hypothetical protein
MCLRMDSVGEEEGCHKGFLGVGLGGWEILDSRMNSGSCMRVERNTAAKNWILHRWANRLPFTYESRGIETKRSPQNLRGGSCFVFTPGVGYGDYVEQITYLLFLKLADEMNELGFGDDWSGLDVDIKGEIYEGLLEKRASSSDKGAVQYFNPRPLIRAIVEVHGSI